MQKGHMVIFVLKGFQKSEILKNAVSGSWCLDSRLFIVVSKVTAVFIVVSKVTGVFIAVSKVTGVFIVVSW